MKLSQIIDIINKIAPEELQEDWDNTGIQLGCDYEKDINRIMTCLEISDSIVEEAAEKKADLIVTHHPLIFSKLSHVDSGDVTGRQIIKLISHGISVYSSHTAFDSAAYGTNYDLASRLGLENITPMFKDEKFQGCGMGRFGSFSSPLPFSEFISKLGQVCSKSGLKIAGTAPETVAKTALCTGAGAEFIDDAYRAGAQVYITGDLKYHDARHADDIGLCVIDAGHYGTEILFADNMADQLRSLLGSEAEIFPAVSDINPFRNGLGMTV